MKRLLAIALILFAINSCTTDFDLTSDYKEVMVVYGLLNQSNEDHFIRIHKGYLDEEKSALDYTGNPDSLYYADILNVTITEKSNNRVTNQWTLDRVNGDTLNPPVKKDGDGDFVSSPNILYHFNADLNPEREYELRVENKETGLVASSSTELVGNFQVTFPNNTLPINWIAPNQYTVRWTRSENSEIYDLVLTMHYSVADVNAPQNKIREDSISWYAFRNRVFTTDNPNHRIDFDEFLQSVQSNLEPDPSIVRHFESLEFEFTVGTPTFSRFINYSVAQSGITQNQATPHYTNVDSAIGLFSARYNKVVKNVDLTPQTIDSLACGSATGDLNFAPSPQVSSYPLCQ